MPSRQDAQSYIRQLGIGADPTDEAAVADGSLSWDEFVNRQQQRAQPNAYSADEIASGASGGSSATQAASGWDGQMRARTSRNDGYTDANGHTTGLAPDTPAGAWSNQPWAGSPPEGVSNQPFSMANDARGSLAGGGAGALMQQLMQRAGQGLNVDRNSAAVRPQADAYAANEERATRNYLSDTAERMGPLANIQGEARIAAERQGQRVGSFESELIAREIGARRDEIAQALQMQGALLTNEQRMALEKELAQLNDAARTADRGLTRELGVMANDSRTADRDLSRNLGERGLGLQEQQNRDAMERFMRELALREWDTGQQWDFNWAGLGV